MPCMIRGGGICVANDGGDLLQIAERSVICSIRIPSGRVLVPLKFTYPYI